jgi:hypothetical protein
MQMVADTSILFYENDENPGLAMDINVNHSQIHIPKQPAFVCELNGNWNLGSSSDIQFDTPRLLRAGSFSGNRYTIPATGAWLFTLSTSMAGGNGTDDTMYFNLQLNDGTIRTAQSNPQFKTRAGIETHETYTFLVQCSQGDTVRWTANGVSYTNPYLILGHYTQWSGVMVG